MSQQVFKSDDPEQQAKSPNFQAGTLDGLLDTRRGSACPPLPERGMDPQKAGSWMYRRGYASTYAPSPCPGCSKCRRGSER